MAPVVIRVDPAPGFQSLSDDTMLRRYRIQIEIGRTKSVNKNPVAERAVQELEAEILRGGNPDREISPIILNDAVACLNYRLRSDGLSAH